MISKFTAKAAALALSACLLVSGASFGSQSAFAATVEKAQTAVTQEPATEPVTQEPTTQEPATEPVTQEPTTQEPATEPVTQEPTTQEPTTEPVTQEPTTQEPTTEPVTQEPTTQEPTTEPVTPKPKPIKLSATSLKLAAGATAKLKVVNAKAKRWVSSKKSVAAVKNGRVYAIRKGSVTVTVRLTNGKKLTCKVRVTTNPSVTVGGKKFKSGSTYTVKKGGRLVVALKGRISAIRNVYSSTVGSVARVVSKNTAEKVVIKGFKKGNATVTVTFNGVAFKIKIKVV